MGTIRQMVERFELKCNALGTECRDALIFWHRRSRSAEEHTPAREIAGRGGGANLLASTRPRMRRSPPMAFLYPLNVLRKLAGQVRSWFTPLRRVVQGHEARPLCGRPLIGLRPLLILGQREESRLKERMAKAVAAATNPA
jgi:hypothetical protein